MLTIVMALIGLPVGILVDDLIERLATEPNDEEYEDVLETPPAAAGASFHAEVGTMLFEREPGHAWRRRAIVIVTTSALFAMAAARFEGAAELSVVSAYCCALLVCAGTDLLSFRVPNVITYPAIVAALVVGAFMPGASLSDALLGGLLAGGILLLPALLTGGVGMGMGDVKLALFVGLALGFQLVPIALLIMALGGGVVASVLMLSGRRKRGEPIPYAPFISVGALVTLLGLGSTFSRLS